jgi:hypothetical protein
MIDFNAMRQAIADKITAESTTIAHVYSTSVSKFAGFPCAVVLPGNNSNDYGSTSDNKMEFVFSVIIYYEAATEADRAAAELAIGDALSEILTIFLPRNALSSVCDWVVPTPSTWVSLSSPGKPELIGAEIELRLRKNVGV